MSDADRGALGGQRQREVDRGRALAHAALARGDRDDVLDVRQQLHAALHRVRDHLAHDIGADVLDPGHAARRGDQRPAQRRDLALGRIAELDVEADVTALDLEVLQLPGADEVAAGVRVDDGLQRVEQRNVGQGRGHGQPMKRMTEGSGEV